MDVPVRWTVRVSKDTDVAVRTSLAHRGMNKGDLAKFIEEAVRWRVLDRTVAEVKARNAKAPRAEIEAAIDEALKTVRNERAAHRAKAGGRAADTVLFMPRVLIYCSHFCTSTCRYSPRLIEKDRIRRSQRIDLNESCRRATNS